MNIYNLDPQALNRVVPVMRHFSDLEPQSVFNRTVLDNVAKAVLVSSTEFKYSESDFITNFNLRVNEINSLKSARTVDTRNDLSPSHFSEAFLIKNKLEAAPFPGQHTDHFKLFLFLSLVAPVLVKYVATLQNTDIDHFATTYKPEAVTLADIESFYLIAVDEDQPRIFNTTKAFELLRKFRQVDIGSNGPLELYSFHYALEYILFATPSSIFDHYLKISNKLATDGVNDELVDNLQYINMASSNRLHSISENVPTTALIEPIRNQFFENLTSLLPQVACKSSLNVTDWIESKPLRFIRPVLSMLQATGQTTYMMYALIDYKVGDVQNYKKVYLTQPDPSTLEVVVGNPSSEDAESHTLSSDCSDDQIFEILESYYA